MDEFVKLAPMRGVRTEVMWAYDVPKLFYSTVEWSAVRQMGRLGVLIWYADKVGYTGRRRRTPMDVDEMVKRWHRLVVGLAVAHDKDEADRFEASVEECLSPILAAPIKQVREFYPKLLAALKKDSKVPYLVWRSYEIWVDQCISKAPDEDVRVLKMDLAREIVAAVEEDVRLQLPEAMVRALQWRSPEALEQVKEAVAEEKAAGRKVRLRGRESCLFLEAGGTEEEPKVCIQI